MIDEIVDEQLLENIEVSLPLDRFGHDREDRADTREKKNWRDRQFDRMGYSNVQEFKHELPQACSNRQRLKRPREHSRISSLSLYLRSQLTNHPLGLVVSFLWCSILVRFPLNWTWTSAVATRFDRCQ
jgi:hypothetical protein